ncbi:glycosyl transferase family 90 [Sphingobacterium litopenaei]|uniref:Lipopolysaccharide biosynthesis protein n=1 Tax=Sphingobacterium litopenaei TaxID=2763500 RepID=A0ABR7YI20_9SPHI|nr:glycosyl transferase family 90 [Sphingobacterium litopenaei]MBD1430964.1 lipopolysaccharide biosynthesis protein [Sphingobacterium litopenaei]
MLNLKRILLGNKNNKLCYYIKALVRGLIPASVYRSYRNRFLNDSPNDSYIHSRVNYYNKLGSERSLSSSAIQIKNYQIPKKIRVYYFDSIEYLRYFNGNNRFEIIPGDVTHVPSFPALVKSRPIDGENANSVLLNLDKARHFNFIKDDFSFLQKKNMLVGRSGFGQAHRARFYDLYKDHALCNLKKAARKSDKDFLSIAGHLGYKFILALEGNDVATNLKWIMSSNSIAVMPKPKFETWFMEGTLIPNVHYICIKDDYLDLEEKLKYYITHTDKALEIIKNANKYVEQFKDNKREKLISLMVLDKYFKFTR